MTAPTTETPPVKVRHRSLIAAILRAAAMRISGKVVEVDDNALVTALGSLALRLDHPALQLRGTPPSTVEDLLREALRLGTQTGVDWWTALPSQTPYYHIDDGDQLVATVCADALPELLARYYLLEEHTP